MPAGFNITDAEIAYAESILLSLGQHLDEEQVAFIKTFETTDLHAVPGSGKTTALLAKLLILEKHLPLPDGSGVLVIAHTNAAVYEIRNAIGSECPKLFSYPNFIGTIQSFVDKFLCNPFFLNRFNRKINRIDNEIYEEMTSKFSRYFPAGGFTTQEHNNAKSYLRINDLYKSYRFGIVDTKWEPFNNGSILEFTKPRGNTRAENYRDWTNEEKLKIKKWVINFKIHIMANGVLCYDDAYLLASTYLELFPAVVKILQNRFRYVFIDEMQDIDQKQHDLLEKIFYVPGGDATFQRIGDKNQAIYGGRVELGTIWNQRENCLLLRGSQRLNPRIASIVQPLALIPIEIEGRRTNSDGSSIDIKPHLILYNDSTIGNVIPSFAKLIRRLQDESKLPSVSDDHNGYKAIGWRKDHEGGKTSITSYCPEFASTIHKSKPDYLFLEDYLYIDHNESMTFEGLYERIFNSILKILRLENVTDDKQRPFSKSKLITFIQDNHSDFYETFKLKMFKWCLSVIKLQRNIALSDVRSFIPSLLSIFGKSISLSSDFINLSSQQNLQTHTIIGNISSNIVEHHGVQIEINTVHSVKGQTHTATLYLETFYQRGSGNFESERLSKQLKGIAFTGGTLLKVVQESARMAYVGFSRPTHLLCFAVDKNRFEDKLNDLSTDIWEIIEA